MMVHCTHSYRDLCKLYVNSPHIKKGDFKGEIFDLLLFTLINRIKLKVHKTENFFDSDFGICIISLLVMPKY
jgi:hypothetical protein